MRIRHMLKQGPMTIAALATALDAKTDSVQKAVTRREGKLFTCLPGADGIDRWALLETRAA